MTAAASVAFFKPEFDDFLYASVAEGDHGMHLTVLSALSRLDLDPWTEAAELSMLPKEAAVGRLARLLTQVPGGTWTSADAKDIALRLVGLLPTTRSSAGVVGAQRARPSRTMLMYILLGLAVVVIGTNVSRYRQASDTGEAPRATREVPQTLPR